MKMLREANNRYTNTQKLLEMYKGEVLELQGALKELKKIDKDGEG